MFKNSLGQQVSNEGSIFPLVTFFPERQSFKCLGTGFFITPRGGFVTAKHVFFQNDGTHVPTLFGIQSLETGERIVRTVVNFVTHKNADIAIGHLGGATIQNIPEIPLASVFIISTQELSIGDEIKTYAFPLTETTYPGATLTEFKFLGRWSVGKIIDYHPDGMSLLRNACYQTSMKIQDGASGGPVFKDNYVIGINSTGMDVEPESEPISAITPINFIREWQFLEKRVFLQ